tara:strand:+ start:3742 stop:4392 length:651 start_codon:yes stop_codon:yes gene_type:complete
VKKKLLILSGPTHEYLDPVRYLGNASSGKMGAALARAAVHIGWDVDVISGPVHPSNLPDLQENGTIHHVTSAEEMYAAAARLFPDVNAAIFAAAVADFRPAQKASQKMDHRDQACSLQLEPTPDIAASLGLEKQPSQKSIGFALQSHDGAQKAQEKLVNKNLDAIVLNSPNAIAADQAAYQWIDHESTSPDNWGVLSKTDCAQRIIQHLSKWFDVT